MVKCLKKTEKIQEFDYKLLKFLFTFVITGILVIVIWALIGIVISGAELFAPTSIGFMQFSFSEYGIIIYVIVTFIFSIILYFL
jgi:hypothetical protein